MLNSCLKNSFKRMHTCRRLLFQRRMDGDESRWRPPSVFFIPLLVCGGLIFFVDLLELNSFRIPSASIALPQPRFVGLIENYNLNGFLIKTEGCRIPYMDAFDSTIKKYIFKENLNACNNDTPPLMDSNLTHVYLLKNSLNAYGVSDDSALKCCYRIIERRTPKENENDNKLIVSKRCFPFNRAVIIHREFIKVTCSYNETEIYKDTFAFVPIKPGLKPKAKQKKVSLNILIIGVDAVSRLNLHRQMPKTVQVLNSMDAVELFGYNKVGDNTFPNLITVLTGMHEEELVKNCWTTKHTQFDNCPFIWKNYSDKGYATAFGEDASWMGIFNYLKRGFKKQPTTYYWGVFNYFSEQLIGNEHSMNVYFCVGGRFVYKTLLEYMNKFVTTMQKSAIPYFGFFWGASLSHDYLNTPKLQDDDYAEFLKKLRVDGALNNTVLFFMSDHGIRWGDIRKTYQGRMEERLPFLFVALPEKYRQAYNQHYTNLRKNSRRLTTPFDLHETLKDLLNPEKLTAAVLNHRMKSNSNKRGFSLFESIPTSRTCDSAGIVSHWCTCQQSVKVNTSDTVVIKAAQFAVAHMNEQLVGYADCAHLSLAEIYNSRLHTLGKHVQVGKNYSNDYTVAFRTVPGNGSFEATIRQHFTKNGASFSFNITGTISRINLYGKQSLCVTDFHLKLYCYCKT